MNLTINLHTGRPYPPLVSPQTESTLRWDFIVKQDVNRLLQFKKKRTLDRIYIHYALTWYDFESIVSLGVWDCRDLQ